MANKYKIYCAGNMTPNADIYFDWVDRLESKLAGLDFKISKSHYKPKELGKFIVRHDLARLKYCDAVVINLGLTDTNHHFTGSLMEIYEAARQGKPVYAFTGRTLERSVQADSPWMKEFITHEFDSLNELVDYLRVEENLPI